MADASRFPNLALPFAITGACAGWLSAGMVSNPLFGFCTTSKPVAAGLATLVGAAIGLILQRLCVGRRYDYEIGDPDPEVRPATDAWPLHAGLIVVAGALTGGLLAAVTPACCTGADCVVGGAACALLFLPVCLAVLAAARRAQRARLGSLVAGSDRRAVWGILAMSLAAMTLEQAVDWPGSATGEVVPPIPALVLLVPLALLTIGILIADARALVRVRAALASGLSAHAARDADEDQAAPVRLDLGLGADLLGRVVRGATAYRHRESTVALVRGTPHLATDALQRALRRGALALALMGGVAAVHAYACTDDAFATYEALHCAPYHPAACEIAASMLENRDPARSRALRRTGRMWRAYDAESDQLDGAGSDPGGE